MSEEDSLEMLFRDSIMVDTYKPADQPAHQENVERISQIPCELSDREQALIFVFAIEICSEINKLRSEPALYVDILIRHRKHFYLEDERGDGTPQLNQHITEGKSAVLECIDDLKERSSCDPLVFRDGIHLASQEIRSVIGADCSVAEPTSPEQVNDALYKFGEYEGRATQLVGFGYENPREILCHLLISDGEPSRRSRDILLDTEYRFGGVSLDESSGMFVLHLISEQWWDAWED